MTERDLHWEDYALCAGMDVRFFHKDDNNKHNYEEDANVARLTDDMCLSCPVMNMCLRVGMEERRHGVWGGVFLVAGKISKSRNAHKSQAIRSRWLKRTGIKGVL